MDVLTAILAFGVAGGYFAVAALIVPKIHLEDATPRFVTAFRVGGVAFFVGCGLTHSHIAYHALADEDSADLHEVIFHLLQVFGVWVFVFAAVRFLDVRVVRRKTEGELRAEELQRTVAELSRSNADLEQFAHVIAHDLQEPLRSVAGFAGLVEHRSSAKLDHGDREALEQISAGTERMATMLSGVLSYSRAAGTGLSHEPVDLNVVVDEVKASLAQAIEERGAQVVAGELPVVSGDRVQLLQLFQNLVGNALKFSPDDGPPQVEIDCTDAAEQWRITVSDRGPGVDPRDAERIFGIFQRASTDRGGSGVGLALARKIVDRHGGEIGVEPRPGGGSVFAVTLPKVLELTAPPPRAPAGAADAAR